MTTCSYDFIKYATGRIMKTILLIENKPDLLKTLTEMLREPGYMIVTKPDAASALLVLREGTRSIL